ncbi:hypothetical protein ACKWTF_006290 [Chironomus riparius]
MSAESHQKRAPSTASESTRLVPNIVPPQAVSDRSIIDSVAGFINDVALTNAPQTNPKDQILWAKFENLADISDTSLGEDCDSEGTLPPPLLLCIGYVNGMQVWAIPANGEAIEVMSWKQGSVNILRILPTPFLSNNSELANDLLNQFIHKRPLMALCGDCPILNQTSSSQNQQLHAVNFVSLKDGDIVKTIRFKTPVVDIVANRTSIAITFYERIAIFDARTLEDRLTVTTCYPCPNGLCPIALGDRWLAYAERKLISSKTSGGGCYADGIPSYTATVLNAAKSLGKGLRELKDQVAAGLTGNVASSSNQGSSSSSVTNPTCAIDGTQPGVVTILDIKHAIKDISPTSGTPVAINGNDPIVAHFIAHSEAIFAMSFDPSGMLLLTADRRGHDFNVFRILPHTCGSVLAAVHHLYVLHRGDTSAKVQDISFSFDSRWVAVSTVRGTTHVFPITSYGGHCGYRTHSAAHVVNRLSRFHRSAGLPVDGRSSSPILMSEHAVQSTAYANPRLPPFPHPTVILPLAQLRQPSSLNSTSTLLSQTTNVAQSGSKGMGRQRHHSIEESHAKPLRVAATFAKARSWLLDPPGMHDTPSRLHRRAVDSLFVIAGHGALIQYDLEPRHASNIPKEKICDETPIELEVEAKAQWILGQRSNSQLEISPPLSADNWLIKDRVIDNNLNLDTSHVGVMSSDERDDRWLSQVEIVTHAGPHRRLWMGPQFVFKLYNTQSGNSLAHIDMESIEVGARARSTPVNMPTMPNSSASTRPLVPVLIESGSCSSYEQSPRLLDSFHYESTDSEIISGPDSQLREDLADAMRDCPAIPLANRDSGSSSMHETQQREAKSFGVDTMMCDEASNLHTVVVSIVNPQGIITTVTDNNNPATQNTVEAFSNENYILENCDETMFRPVITVLNVSNKMSEMVNVEECSKPVEVPLELVVPVIDERVLEEKKRKKEVEQKQKAQQQLEKQEKLILESQKSKKVEKESVVVEVKKNTIENKKNTETKKEDFNGQTKKNKKAQKYNKKSQDDEKKATETSHVVKNTIISQQAKIEEVKVEEKVEEIKVEIEKNMDVSLTREVEDKNIVLEESSEHEPVKISYEIENEGIKEFCEAVTEPKIEIEIVKKEEEKINPIELSAEIALNAVLDEELNAEISNNEKLEVTIAEELFLKPVEVKARSPSPQPEKIEVKVEELSFKFEEKVEEKAKEELLVKKSENPDKDAWKRNKKGKKKNQLATKVEAQKPIEFPPLASNFPSFKSTFAENTKTIANIKTQLTFEAIEEPSVNFPPLDTIKLPSPEVTVIQSTVLTKLPTPDFPDLPPLEEYNKEIDQDAVMKISMHEIIGDEEIQIIPHEDTVEIHDSPQKLSSDIEIIEEHFVLPIESEKVEIKETFIKNDDFYDDIDDELPPLEPLEPFDATYDGFIVKEEEEKACYVEDNVEFKEKQEMKKKMSELLKDTNMVFAMCSSLKELKVDEESKSISSSSQIQRSTSSSLTTNTTTSTFASANSNQYCEGHDSDYKSLDLEMEEAIVSAQEQDDPDPVFKIPPILKTPSFEKEDPEDISSFEATSSETDAEDSSKKSNIQTKFKQEDDEELRPLLETSTTSLTPVSSGGMTIITNITTTDANDTPTLPDINQKLQATSNNNSNNGKRKNKKKRR